MKKILTLIGKDARIFFADPIAIGLGFLVPLVMILVFGMIFGGSHEGLSEVVVLAVNQDQGPAGKRLLTSLDSLKEIRIVQKLRNDSLALDSAKARQRVETGKNSLTIIVPKDFSAGLKVGEVRLSILEDPRNSIAAGIVNGLLQRQVFSTFPGILPATMMKQNFGADSLMQKGFNQDLSRILQKNFKFTIPESLSLAQAIPESWLLGSDPDTTKKADSSKFGLDKAMENVFKVKREAVVGQKIVHANIAQNVAGPAIMFMLFAVGAIGASLLREMRDGTAHRLLVSRVSSAQLLVSKYLWAVLLGGFQLICMMLYGWIVFGLEIYSQPVALLLVIFSTAAATSSLGLFIASLSKTEEQATGYQIVIILSMSAIGGAMVPSFLMPKAIHTVAVITPVHWAMQGFLNVFWYNQSLAQILPQCGILLGMAALMVGISVILFRKRLATELG